MRRCLGRTNTLHRCKRDVSSGVLCHNHQYQWLLFTSFMIFTVGGGLASFYSLLSFQDEPSVPAAFIARIEKDDISVAAGRLTTYWDVLEDGRGLLAMAGPIDVDNMVVMIKNEHGNVTNILQGTLAKDTGRRRIFTYPPIPFDGSTLEFGVQAFMGKQKSETSFKIELIADADP